jgi:hypothetical protein
MTQRYHWNRIVASAANGLFGGLAVDLILGGVGALLALIPSLPDPPGWAQALIICGVAGLPIGLAIALGCAEAQSQLEEYRAATNQCRHCGYSLRGIRQASERCPECGELFKKLP